MIKKKVRFVKDVKKHDGKDIKNQLLINLIEQYVKNVSYTINNIHIIIPNRGIRYEIFQYLLQILKIVENKPGQPVPIFTHTASKFSFNHPFQLIPLINALIISLRNRK